MSARWTNGGVGGGGGDSGGDSDSNIAARRNEVNLALAVTRQLADINGQFSYGMGSVTDVLFDDTNIDSDGTTMTVQAGATPPPGLVAENAVATDVTSAISGGDRLGVRFTSDITGAVSGVTLVQGTAVNSFNVSVQIWTDDGGSPGVQVGDTSGSFFTGNWNDGNELTITWFGEAPSLTSGTDYWLLVSHSNGDGQLTLERNAGTAPFGKALDGEASTTISDGSNGEDGELIFTIAGGVQESFSLETKSHTALAAPASIRGVLRIVELDGALDLASDMAMSMSRDDGVTWTVAALEQVAEQTINDTTYLVIEGSADVTGQPSGTDVRMRVTNAASSASFSIASIYWGWQ